jgi:hypothetical protein
MNIRFCHISEHAIVEIEIKRVTGIDQCISPKVAQHTQIITHSGLTSAYLTIYSHSKRKTRHGGFTARPYIESVQKESAWGIPF